MAVIKRGKYYHYAFMFHGKRIQKSADTTNRKVAEQVEEAHKRKLHAGHFGITEDAQRNQTLKQVLTAYMEAHAIKYPRQTNTDKYGAAHLIEHLGNEFLSAIDPKAVIGFQAKRQQEGAKPPTIDNDVALLCRATGVHGKLLRAALQEADQFVLNRNPVLKGRPFASLEQDKLYAAAAEMKDRYVYIEFVLRLALNCGMRKGEIRKITWGSLSFLMDALEVCKSKSVGSTNRIIAFNEEVQASFGQHCAWYGRQFGKREDFIDGRPPNGWYVFPYKRRGFFDPTRPVTSIDHEWRAVRKAAGVDGRFHDCRHTTCSMLGDAGATAEQMKAIMGHLSDAMVKRYCKISHHTSRELLNKLPQHRDKMRELEIEEGRRLAERFSGLSTQQKHTIN